MVHMQIMVSFEKVTGHNFFKLSLKIYTFLWFVYLEFYADHLFAVHVMRMLNKNTWDVKKCGANQKQHCKQAAATKRFDIS